MTDVGKSAKQMGKPHPNVLRRLDPVPERPTPAAQGSKRKHFGYSSLPRSRIFRKSRRHYEWFHTAKARDQAAMNLIIRVGAVFDLRMEQR